MADRNGAQGGSGIVGTVAAVAILAAAAVAPSPASATATAGPQPGTPGPTDPPEPRTTKTGLLGKIDLFQQRNRATSFGVGVLKKFGDDRAGRLAALVAYYGFFSVFPAMLALVTVLGFVLEDNPDLRDDIAGSALAQFPIVGDSIAESVSSGLTGNTVALVVGLAGAIWAGMGMVQACQDAMNEVWAVEREDYPNFVMKRVRSLIMLLLIVVLLVVSTGLGQVVGALGVGVAGVVLLFIASIVLNIGVFMVAYRVLTVADVSWAQVLRGAIFAGAVYTVLQALGGLYVDRVLKGATETYGTFAVVIGLLSWIFLIAQVLMLGAEVNTVADKRMWPRSLFGQPATPGDRRSHADQARAQKMDDSMTVDVDFQR
jgi:membrane protein